MNPKKATTWFRAHRTLAVGLIALVLGIALVVLVAIPLAMTSSADFFSRYHLLNRRYVNLESSKHADIGCRDCHETNALRNGPQLVADFYRSLFTNEELPAYFQFKPPTNDACLKCHEADWSDEATRTARIPHPAHTRVASEDRECVRCHKWTAHLETYLDKHKEMPFSGVCVAYGCHVGTKRTTQCFDCHHVLEQTAAEWKTKHPEVVKTAGQNGCLEHCHKVDQCQTCHTTGKTPEFTGRPTQVGLDIEKLHVKKDWTQKYHGTEALKNREQCLLCHQSQGECQECHRYRPAFHGKTLTWIGRHSKVATSVTDPRCIECHKEKFCKDCHAQFEEME